MNKAVAQPASSQTASTEAASEVLGCSGKVAQAIPGAIPAYVAGLFAVTIGLGVVSLALDGATATAVLPALACLIVLTAAARLSVSFRYHNELMALSLFEAALAAAIVAFGGIAVAALAMAAQALSEAHQKVRPMKASFNVAQWGLAALAGSLVYQVAGGGAANATGAVVALLAAMATVGAVNTAAFTVAIRLAHGQSLRSVFTSHAPTIIAGWTVNGAFGLLFAGAFGWHPAMAVVMIVPLVTLHWAYRGHAEVQADRARLAGLHRATEVLSEPMNPRDAIPRFLAEIRETFAADVAELILIDGPIRTIHRIGQGRLSAYGTTTEPAERETLATAIMERGTPVRVTAATPDVQLGGLLRRAGYRDCLASPLGARGNVIGLLCTYNRAGLEGFEEGELSVLEALARAAAAAIAKAELLETILDERRKLSDIVDHASDGIFSVAADGTVLTWNSAFESISGFSAQEMIGTRSLAVLRGRDEAGDDVSLERWESIPGELPERFQIVTFGGDTRVLGCSYSAVRPKDGAPPVLVVIARDKTRAVELERMREDFVAAVSHELRTPLTPIKGFASTLVDWGETLGADGRRDAARSILRASDRLERLITNLLEVTMVERGVEKPHGEIDAAAAVAKTVSDFRVSYPDRVIRLTMPAEPCMAFGDWLWIEQITSNILSNALKYSPADQPVDVVIQSHDAGVEVVIADCGAGIRKKDHDRVFERFVRLDDDVTRSSGGAGLGLYVSRHLARAMGGELDLTPSTSGARFLLTLSAVRRLSALVSKL